MAYRLFLCGDVMTGRGIDQILPHPCDPVLHEDYTQSAIGYVQLAEAANGPIPVCTENPIRIDWGGNHLTSAHNDRAAIFCP